MEGGRGRRSRRIVEVSDALDASERRFRSAFDSSAVGMAELDTSGRFTAVNAALLRILGYDETELLGRSFEDITHPDDLPECRLLVAGLLAGETESFQIEKRYVAKSGATIWAINSVSVVRDADGHATSFLGQVQDITERKRTEQGLAAASSKLEAIIRAFPDLYFHLDAAGTILDYSAGKKADLYAPPEQFLGKKMRDVMPDDVGARLDEALRAALRRHRLVSTEYTLGLPGGLADFEARIAPLGEKDALVIVRNITDRKRLEEQLRQAQKMEAVGKLAGGIAHDFNNLLTAILGYSDILLREVHGSSRESVEEIRRAGERAAALTRQLLAFSRKQMLRMELLDVNQLVGEMEKMLARVLGDDIVLEVAAAPVLPSVRADRTQLEQVVLNLAVNARDAMPKGGTLTIETRALELESDHGTVPPGSWVVVSVSDTGAGMDARTKARIFEPFFTTKERGKGTGLGLATVYGAVTQVGGQIAVTSEPGEGARFDVYLPAACGEPERSIAPIRDEDPGAGETVLVVEDQEAVRKLAARVLQSHGYEVLEAANGAEALGLASRRGERIDVILTDIVMPGMSGPDVVARMSYLHPETNVVYMSGYSDSSLLKQGALHAGDHFLQKPFTADALVAKVRAALGSRADEDVA